MPRERIAALEAWVIGGLTPDLTLVFDVPVDTALARLAGVSKDRFESEGRSYFERVRAGYLERAGKEPRRMRVIDSGRALDKVKKEVEKIVLSLC